MAASTVWCPARSGVASESVELPTVHALYQVSDPIQFSPDGRWVLSQCGVAVQCWSARDGKLLGSFPTAVPALSPDGATLATVRRWPKGLGRELSIVLWSLETRLPLREWKIQDAGDHEARCMAFAPEGDEIVVVTSSWAKGQTDMIRCRLDGTTVRKASLDVEVTARSARLTPDLSTLVADRGIDGRAIKAWRVDDGSEIWSLDAPVIDPALSPDGSLIAARARDPILDRSDQEIVLISTARGEIVRRLATAVDPQGGLTSANTIAFCPDGRTLWFGFRPESSDEPPDIHVYLAADGSKIGEFPGHGPAFALSPDGESVASGLGDLEVWRSATNEIVWRTGKSGLERIEDIEGTPYGLLVQYVRDGRQTLDLWRVDEDPVPEVPQTVGIRAVSPDGRLVARWTGDGAITVTEYGTERTVARLTTKGYWGTVLFSPDSRTLLVYNRDLKAWDVERGTLIFENRAVLNVLTAPPPPAAFLDGGHMIATGTEGVNVWRAEDGALLGTLATGNTGGEDRVTALAVSEDGTILAASGADGRILVWDTGTWEARPPIAAHQRRINDLEFLPRSHVMVTGSDDGTVAFWCASTGSRIETVDRRDPVYEVVPSDSGKTLSVRQSAGVFSLRLDPGPLPTCGPVFVRGDSDGNGRIAISDAIVTLAYSFLGGGVPPCRDAADFDDDGDIDIVDPILTLSWLFRGGDPPAQLGCHPDTSAPDDLECLASGWCR